MQKVRLHLQPNTLNLPHIDAIYERFTGFTLPTPDVEWFGAKGLVIQPSSMQSGQPFTYIEKGNEPFENGTTLIIKQVEFLYHTYGNQK